MEEVQGGGERSSGCERATPYTPSKKKKWMCNLCISLMTAGSQGGQASKSGRNLSPLPALLQPSSTDCQITMESEVNCAFMLFTIIRYDLLFPPPNLLL